MDASVTLASLGIQPEAISDRFWAKVDRGEPEACWPWTACTHPNGYGLFKLGSRKAGTATTGKAHRVAFEIEHGEIAAGLSVLHRCDNRPCCNPRHLFLGTKGENNRDRDLEGRTSKGAQQSDAKLTEATVREARRLASSMTVTALADRYGVSHPTMWKAVNGQTWRHVQ